MAAPYPDIPFGLAEDFKFECQKDGVVIGKDVCLNGGYSLPPTPTSSPNFYPHSHSPCLSENEDWQFYAEVPNQSPNHSLEDSFGHKSLNCNDYPCGGASNNHYTNSPSSGSESFSHSPSPSPPLTSHPQNRAGGATTTSTVNSVANKTSQSIILSGLPTSSPKGGTSGMPLQHILFIDSRPYQLIPHQQNEGFSQESPQPLQVRLLNPSQQQAAGGPPQTSLPPLTQEGNSGHFDNGQPSQTSRSTSNSSQRHEAHNSQELTENSEDTEEDAGLGVAGTGASELDYQVDQIPSKEFESHEIESGQSSSQEMTSQGNDCECPIPNLLNDSGLYGFKVLLDAKEDTLKTPTWLVSSITNKLYTNMNKPIPFRVILKKGPPLKRKLHLRAMAVFKYPMFLRQNVVRCPNHLNPLDSTNIDFLYTNHVIRADHPRAVYETSASGRLSVVVPLDFPEHRAEAIPVLLKFMCHNSCVGGINRRPMAVLLTLEHHEEEMGRYTVDVRVCACPSRDVKTEEKQLITKGLYKKAGHHTFESRRSRKRQRKDDEQGRYDEDQIYYLPIRGATLFNFLQDTKIHYLKHHPEYASRFPDPPMDLGLKMLEDLPQASSEFLREENQPPDSPLSPYPKESSQPLILVYSNVRDKESHQVLSEGELPPEIRLSITDNDRKRTQLETGLSPIDPPIISMKKASLSCSDDDDAGDEERIHYGSQKGSKKSPKSDLPRTNSSSGGRGTTLNGKHKTKMSLTKAQQRHLMVASMPEKQKGNGLIRILPKNLEEADGSRLKEALEGTTMSAEEAIQEDEKVMLAAHVLASHLGAHQIDK